MNKNYLKVAYIFLFSTILILGACKPDKRDITIEKAGIVKVYMPEAKGLNEYKYNFDDESNSILFSASSEGGKPATEDVLLKFKVDFAMVSAYNEESGTDYLPLPSAYLEYLEKDVVILKGEKETGELSLGINIDPNEVLVSTDYLVPITISSPGDPKLIQENSYVVFFKITVVIDEPEPEVVQLKVMSLGRGGYGYTDAQLEKAANAIGDIKPDILVIRELEDNPETGNRIEKWSALVDLESVDLEHRVFIKAPQVYTNGRELGLAVYSKYPISNIQTYELSTLTLPFGVVDLDVNGKILKVAAIVTDNNSTAAVRAEHLDKIMEVLEDIDGPIVVAGYIGGNPNLVTDAFYLGFKSLDIVIPCAPCAANTYTTTAPTLWSDMIVYRPWEGFNMNVIKHEVGTVAQAPNSHLPVITTFEVTF